MAVSSVANSDTFKATTPSDREIALTRLFDAPRRLVFDAMTKPEHVRRWWGSSTTATRSRVRDRPSPGRRLALRRPRPEGRRRFPRRVSRDRRARAPRLHRDLRAVPRRRIGRDLGPHRGGRQDPPDRHRLYPSLEVRDTVLETGMTQGRRHQLRPPRGPRARVAAVMTVNCGADVVINQRQLCFPALAALQRASSPRCMHSP